MALFGMLTYLSVETMKMPHSGFNLTTKLVNHTYLPLIGREGNAVQKLSPRIRCTLSRENLSPLASDESSDIADLDSTDDDEFGHVIKFQHSDFKIRDRVSIGLGGRADEAVFEGVVKNPHSPLHKKRVVLRRLDSAQAQRRGKRAIQVLKKLARRRLMYRSYSMQVHGYMCSSTNGDYGSLTLVHGYHGSFSLRHWLQQKDWLPTLEATLALDEESLRRVGDDTVGGPAISRQLRLIRILMRDLLIGVNYLHSHGLAHTELRLENLHLSPVDRHVKVGILGNAAYFYDESPENQQLESSSKRQQMMIAFDMRCLGFIIAKMVLRELMDPLIFAKLKAFLRKGNEPSCLREFLLRTFNQNSSYGNSGLQILDRNWGAGWHLLSLLLAPKPSERIKCLDALRHPFLCGPRWRVDPSMNIIRWSLGSTAVRIAEEYIYGPQQNWVEHLPGKWRLLYCTGKHVGLTFRQPYSRVLIGYVHLTVRRPSKSNPTFVFSSNIGFTVLIGREWPHDKSGVPGYLQSRSSFRLTSGRRLYLTEVNKAPHTLPSFGPNAQDLVIKRLSGKKWRKALPQSDLPSSLPVARLIANEAEVSISLNKPLSENISPQEVVHEVRLEVPPEMFDPSKFICGTYLDSRLLVLRSVNGSALLFSRSCE